MKRIILLLCSTMFFTINSYGQIIVSGTDAEKLWNQLDLIGKIENYPLIYTKGNHQLIHIDDISCVFERYDACSFFVTTPLERKMIVAMDGTATLMNLLAHLGIEVDEENARMDVTDIFCQNDTKTISCKIEN